MKKVLSLVLSLVMAFSIISGMDVSAFAGTSNTTIEISDDIVKHMVGSSFGVSASYKSDTYSHSEDTISYEISGPEGGMELSGGLSCLGTKEDGIISYPFIATRVGKYVVTIKGPDGAQDSVDVFVSNEDLTTYLADAIKNKNSIMRTDSFCLYKPDMGWTIENIFYKCLGEGTGFDFSSTQLVETVLIRVLVEKLTREDIVERAYAETASNVTKCIGGVIGLNSAFTKETTVNNLSDAAKDYINDFYKFDVFDTLSSAIDGATTLLKVSQAASFYKTVSEHISAEQLKEMFTIILPEMYGESLDSRCELQLLSSAYNSLLSAIENVDIKISEYMAGTAATYGLNTFKELIEDVTLSLAANTLNIVCPGLGTALSVGMTVVSLCKAIDSIFTGKLDGVEKCLGIVNLLGELYRDALYFHCKDFSNGNTNSAYYVVESYQFWIAASQIAVNIQSENIGLLQNELMKEILPKPTIKLAGIFKQAEMMANEYDEFLTSYNLVTERYPVLLEFCNKTLTNEREFLRKTTEDYLFYVYGSNVYEYNSDLWEIPTRYTIIYSQNYSNDVIENFEEIDFVYEGEILDSRKTPRQRSGYEFTGWYIDSECKTKYNFSSPIISDITLYAGWEAEIKYEHINDINARVTDICDDTNTYSLNRSAARKTILNEVISQIDVIIPICMDDHFITEIATNAVPSSVSSIFISEYVEKIEANAIPKSTIIYCEAGTYAEKYANDNGYSCVQASDGATVSTTGKIGVLSYTIVNGNATITDCEYDYTGSITIPKQIGCYDVTCIGSSAFYNCTSLTSITIPDSVTSIGASAFRNCTNLTSATIGNGITSIGYKTFEGCTNLTSINIPDSVTSIDSSAFYECGSLTSIVIPEGVTSIGSYAFYKCTSLTSITIPNSVTSIGEHAFAGCKSLESVYITDLAAWCSIDFYNSFSIPLYYADKLYINGELATDIVIPNGVTIISEYAFSCENIVSVTIPDSVTSIGDYAFSECTSLTSVNIGNGVTSIGYGAFYCCTNLNSIIIGNSVTSIGNYAFEGCTSLESVYITDLAAWCDIDFSLKDSNPLKYAKNLYINGELATDIVIPDGVTTIPRYAFSCENIVSVTIPDSVTNIGSYAFSNCESLTSITISESITSISDYVFYNCANLTSITIPDSVTSIGEEAFSYCTSLTFVTIGNDVTSIDNFAFQGCKSLESVYITDLAAWCGIDFYSSSSNPLYYADKLYINEELATDIIIPNGVTTIPTYVFSCENIVSVTIPDSVTSIGNGAFEGCTSFTSIEIPYSVTSIDSYVFYGCTGLTSITIPDSVTKIGSYAFANCTSLTMVTIPDSVTKIGFYAFRNCTSLTTVTIPDSVTSIGEEAFNGCTSLTSITIPDSVVSIDRCAFYECTSLTSVIIPDSVTSIGYSAFRDCTSLTDVYYGGTEADWANITIGSYNSYLTNATIHYNTMGHSYSDWKITKEPTCVEDGLKSKTCSDCGNVVTEEIPAKGHTPGDWITDENATVNATGSKHKECVVCSKTVETAAIPQLKPATPTLSSVANTPTGVKFVWGKVTGADSYVVYRRTYNASTKTWSGWQNIAKGVKTNSYLDTTAKSGTYYIYTVRAGNEAGYSGYNATGLKTYFLSTPKLSSVTNSSTGVTVKWGKVTGATNYVVYRRAYNATTKKWSGWTNLGKTTATSFADKTAKSGNYYIYTVKALAGTYTSSYNTTGLKTYFLSAPALSSATSTTSGVKFTWGKVAGASGYIVYRRTYNATTKTWGGWTNLGKTTSASFVDKSAKKGTYYIYTTKAYYGSYTSSYNTTGLKVKDVY